MLGMTRKRMAGMIAALAIALALVLILATAASAGGKGPVVHRVHVGGPDACEGAFGLGPGCDANFSLVATEHADGSVSGQYSDQFAGDLGGFHAVIDCLSVVGTDAWVSGWITHGNVGGIDLAGEPVATRVQDNGASANDLADKISYSFIGVNTSCTDQTNYPLFDAPQGQVKVD